MKKTKKIIVLLLLIYCFILTAAYAAVPSVSLVKVKVLDSNHVPVSQAKVRVFYAGTEECEFEKLTNEQGEVTLGPLREDSQFFLVIDLEGLKGQRGYPERIFGGSEYTVYYVSPIYLVSNYGDKKKHEKNNGLEITVNKKDYVDVELFGQGKCSSLLLSQASPAGSRAVLETNGKRFIRIYLTLHQNYFLQKADYANLFDKRMFYAESGLVFTLH